MKGAFFPTLLIVWTPLSPGFCLHRQTKGGYFVDGSIETVNRSFGLFYTVFVYKVGQRVSTFFSADYAHNLVLL